MKNTVMLLMIMPLLVSAYQFSGQYDYNYYYFQEVNYYNENRITLSLTENKGIASLYIQGMGQFYIGSPRFTIPYPDGIPDYILDNMPSYVQLSNSMILNHAYISLFWKGFNVKLGKYPMKWGVSQTYAPADIFSFETPMNYFYIREGIWGLSAAYSFLDNTVTFIYQDNPQYEKTKQGLMFENINDFMTVSVFTAHFFSANRSLNGLVFRTDSNEYVLGGISAACDFWGPGIWVEGDYFFDMDGSANNASHYYIIAGTDYTFHEFLYMSLEYIYYSRGRESPYQFTDLLIRYLNDNYLIGKHYLISVIGINQGEDISGEMAVISNMEDQSSYATFNLVYQPREYIRAILGASFFSGADNEDFSGLPPVYNFSITFNF